MKEMKRILSLFLCLAMLVGYLPVGAMATENEGAQLETTAPVETVLLTADGENEETEKNTEPVVTDPAVTEPVDPKTVVPETTAPETTVPETTVPETTVPETTVPETTVPETTVPEETEPEETVPEETKPQDDAWTKYQEALKRYEELIAKLEASHKLAMEKEAAEKAAKKPSFFLEVAGGASDTAAAAVALADAAPIYILAGGDFQQAGDHAGSAENVRNILAQISQKYPTMDGMLFVGDYDCETHGDDNETTAGIAALMDTVDNTYGNLNHSNSILVQGNHDYKDSNIDTTGGHDFDGYSVFVMNEDDYPDGGGTEAGVQALANNLKAWLNTKLGEGYDAPIFITSHLPLAFSPRTNVVGDGKYAKLIFDVLNHAAGEGLNIIFMHGHNHAYGNDNYLGGEAIYLPKGEKINIAELGSTTKWTEETLNFTYMNPGYVGYYNDWNYVTTEGTDKLTMTVFAITNSEVTVERYSANGLYNLKSEGRNGRYKRGSEASADSLGLAYNTTVYTSPQTISLGAVEDYGDIGSWVGVKAEVTDDVTTSNKGWVEILEPVAGKTTYAYTQADSITAGGEYVIVGNNHNVALQGTTAIGTQAVTINGTALTSDVLLTEWTFSGANSGTIYNGTRYLRYNNDFALHTKSTNLKFTDNGSNFRVWYDDTGWFSKDYSFYYNGTSWTRSDDTQYVRLFVRNEAGDKTTGDVNGAWSKITGNLTYTATAGMNAEQAMALVQAGIDGYYITGMTAPGSDVTGTKVDDSTLTWEWVDTFNGNTAGDYEVAIKYGDFLLGTAEVIVPATTTYYAAEGNGLYLVDMNTTEANAMAAVKAGVTVSSATDASGSNKTPISDDEVTWNWVDTYNGADSGPYTVEILKDGTSLGTVEVKVDIQYETGIETDWTFIEETQGSSGGTYYERVENVSELVSGEQYLIIFDCSSQTTEDAFVIPTIVTTGSGSSQRKGPDVVTSAGITNNATITGNYDNYLWTLTKSGNGWKIGNSSQNINVTMNNTSSRGELSLTTSGEVLTIASGSNNPTDANSYSYAIYDSSNLYWQYNTSATLVYATDGDDYTSRFIFYGVKQGEATPAREVWALVEGPTVYTVPQRTSAAKALAAVKADITGYTATDANGTGKTEIPDGDLDFDWKNTYNGLVTGPYWVEISYQGKVLGTVVVNVEPGVVNNYPEYPNEGAVKVSKTGTGIDFQSSGIAQVEISASGVPMKKGADVIIMVDTSSSMNTCITHGTRNCSNSACRGNYRSHVFEKSLTNLISQLKTPGDDGKMMDLRVAIADFNGFDKDTDKHPWSWNPKDIFVDDVAYDATNHGTVYTGSAPNTRNLTATAFSNVADLKDSYSFTYHSGTNYDYAFDVIYQLATAAKASSQEDRDLFVIFMSDGAPMQYNYFHSNGRSDLLQYYLQGQITETSSLSYRYDGQENTTYRTATGYGAFKTGANTAYYHPEGKHWMAEAIKGDPNNTDGYKVIRKGFATDDDGFTTIQGLGAKMFSIAFCPAVDQHTPIVAMTHVLESIASEQTGTTKYYYNVSDETGLANAFTSIGSEIAYAAYNARFVDQMGDDYNLQLLPAQYTVVDGTNTSTESLAPEIEIISYDIYTRQDYLNGTITADKIGDRKGTYTVLETITTNMVEVTAGTGSYEKVETKDKDGNVLTVNYKPVEKGNYNLEVYSDHINGGTTNILADGTKTGYVKGVIYAKTFIYNTNVQSVAVEGVSIPTGTKTDGTTTGSTNVLPSETFYWKMGTVQTSELAMRYYVYLTGSMEGTREAGSYPTNEYATLYYDNYLHNPCYKETVSPVMPWKEANVSYAFYLVDENGNIIVNQTTGQTGSFANKIAVTNPVVYKTVLLNSGADVQAKIIADDDDVLPKYYTLYDTDAEYEIKVASNGTGSWTISKGDNVDVATTYVTQYKTDDASAYSNALSSSGGSVDYTHTIVWFAVKWEVGAHPDSVVVDYGLPVDISVLANDMFGENGKLAGVGAYSDSLNLDGHTDTNELPDTTYTGTYGTAKADTTTGKVRYTLKTMSMDSYEKFAYSVRYTGNENAGYYYDTVTVIPATTIYYEDSFLTFAGNNAGEATKDVISQSTDGETVPGQWYLEGKKADKTQDEDRPGKYSLTDANNIYGYDSVNNGMSMYSLGSAAKVHVDANSYATAEFSFSGTGFDVISMTSNTTGALAVKVTAGEEITMDNKTYQKGDTVKAHFVNTYYGYKLEAGDANKDGVVDEGEMIWVVNPEAKDSLYQVPVIQIENLPYAKYDVLITATYAVYMDKTSEDGYDLYLDAIRIYNPANDGVKDDDTTIQDAYKADGEAWPSYIELRNKLIDPNNDGILTDGTLGNDDTDTEIIGEVFIDGDGEVKDAQIEDYKNFGPNNEVYLANGQSVAFILGNVTTNVQSIHLGAKSANGNNVTYTIKNIARADNTEAGVKAGQVYNEKTNSLNTATDMYYDITGWRNNIIVITNTSESILSLTNIKATYKSNPNAAVGTSEGEGEDVIVTDLQGASSQEVYVYMTPAAATLTVRSLNNDLDEPETPDVTEPSQPEESVPEESIPETTEPDVTEPEETEPEETQPDKKADKIQKEIEKALKKAAEEAERVAKELQKAAAKAAKTLSKLFSKWF